MDLGETPPKEEIGKYGAFNGMQSKPSPSPEEKQYLILIPITPCSRNSILPLCLLSSVVAVEMIILYRRF